MILRVSEKILYLINTLIKYSSQARCIMFKQSWTIKNSKRKSMSPKLSKLILCCCEPIFSIGNVIKGLPKEVLFFIQVLHELFSEWMIKGILCKIWCGRCLLKASLDMNVKRDHHNIFKFFSAFVLTSHECTSQYCFGLVFRVQNVWLSGNFPYK